MNAHSCPEKVWKDFVTKLAKLEEHMLLAPTVQIRRLHKKVRVSMSLYGERS